MGNTSAFKLRYQYWKETGELPYQNGIKRNLQSNLVGSSSVESGILPGYDGGKDGDNIFKYTNSNGGVRYVYQDNPDAEEVPVRPLNTIFPDPAQWTFTDDAGKFYTPRRTTPTNTAELNPDNRTGFERALDNYIGEAFNTVPKGYHTLPAIGAAAFGLANPVLGEAALTSGFGAHGLSKWMNGEVNGPMDAAMTALEITPLGRVAKPVWNATKEGLQYTTKAIDNATRYASPSYDLYRTIGETTPGVRVRNPYVDVKGLKGTDKSYIKIKSSLENLADAKRGNKNEAYYLFAPKDIDILKLRNARFGNGKAYDGPILGSGSVDGKFVSYGEPWMEFAPSEKTALYEMLTGPRRGPNLMATDFRGNRMDYSVNEAYNAVLRDRQFHKDIKNMELGDILKFKRDNYPDLIKGIPTDIYHANQTVIPNKNWNFDKFLKTPFWKYSENPISGQVQKELMMRWPEAKPLETSTIEWADAARTPQITAENAASITPAQWTAAQDAAIARGDMAEAQRLRDLHFKVSAPNTTIVNELDDPTHNYHGTTSTFTAFDPQKVGLTTGDKSGFFFTDNKKVANFYSHETGSAWNNLKLMLGLYKGHKPQIYDVYLNTTKPMITDFHGGVDEVGREILAKEAIKNGNDANILQNIIDGPPALPHNVTIMRNPKHIKLANAVTYDDKGIRIPLGERDNFKLNDIRYGLLPFIGLGTARILYGMPNKK